MRARLLRTFLFAAVVAAMWTLALPALAAPAPFCDDRGASALAAPPTLQAPEQAIARAPAPSCPLEDAGVIPAVSPDRTVRSTLAAEDPVLPAGLLPLPPPSTEELPDIARPGVPSTGIRWRVERPPRG